MKYTLDKKEQYTILELQEEKLDSGLAPLLKSEFVTFHAEGIRNLIMDLSKVQYADSSGLSALLIANRLCKELKGILVLVGLQPGLEKLVKISQLTTILTIFPTIEEGVDAVFMHEIESKLSEDDTQ